MHSVRVAAACASQIAARVTGGPAARLRRLDENVPDALVQLGCAVVGVARKDLAQHLEKLSARARVSKLRFDHFFSGSG